MQSKVVALILMASVALAVFASVQAEEDKMDFWAVNKRVCHEESKEGCEPCCSEYGYSQAEHRISHADCTCWLKTDSKLRDSDEIRGYPKDKFDYTVFQNPQ